MRTTRPVVQVAMALMRAPTDRHWGYGLSKQAGVRSGVLYPMLQRLLDAGFVEDGWEDPTTIGEKRPPRRYYKLTGKGQLELNAVIEKARFDARFEDLFKETEQDPRYEPSRRERWAW